MLTRAFRSCWRRCKKITSLTFSNFLRTTCTSTCTDWGHIPQLCNRSKFLRGFTRITYPVSDSEICMTLASNIKKKIGPRTEISKIKNVLNGREFFSEIACHSVGPRLSKNKFSRIPRHFTFNFQFQSSCCSIKHEPGIAQDLSSALTRSNRWENYHWAAVKPLQMVFRIKLWSGAQKAAYQV